MGLDPSFRGVGLGWLMGGRRGRGGERGVTEVSFICVREVWTVAIMGIMQITDSFFGVWIFKGQIGVVGSDFLLGI